MACFFARGEASWYHQDSDEYILGVAPVAEGADTSLPAQLRTQNVGLPGDDFWQLNAYLKAYYYGFPWRNRLRTRLGFGTGLSYATKAPFMEQRDQAIRGRDTSKLLLYGDPTLDFSVGDLFSVRELRETYLGVGVSHRSGIFGSSRLFGNVAGGSNYIYGYIETKF